MGKKKKKINGPFTFTQYNLTVLRFSCEWRLLTASVFEKQMSPDHQVLTEGSRCTD